jgi:1-acyl-sn-glycerol-3-phosphate acyltransferase
MSVPIATAPHGTAFCSRSAPRTFAARSAEASRPYTVVNRGGEPMTVRRTLALTAAVAAFLAILARLVSGARVRWVGSRPSTRQRIYFANHTSHLDAAVIWSVLPAEVRALTRPVAARDYWDRDPVRRYLSTRVFNALLISRTRDPAAPNPVDLMVEALGDRHSLILFPEGTRGPGPDVGPFKSGLYHVARQRPDVELVPVNLGDLYRILPKSAYVPVPLLSTITFGPPVRLEPDESKEAFLERAREAVRALAPVRTRVPAAGAR